MKARIYQPTKTAMQSGKAQTRKWRLEYDTAGTRFVEPLMGWTSSGDTRRQLKLRFDTEAKAVAYCERNGIPYQLFEANSSPRRSISYSDNFAFKRRDAWTH